MRVILDVIQSADLSIGKSRGKGLGAVLLAIIAICVVLQGGSILDFGTGRVTDASEPVAHGREN